MLAELLREGFAQAHQRPGLIILDIVWKLIWLVLTLVGLAAFTYGVASQVPWPPLNLRQVAGQFFGTLLMVLGASAVLWLILEGIFRKKLVVAGFSPRSTSTSLIAFIGSGVGKLVIVCGAIVTLGTFSLRDHEVLMPALVVVSALAFFMSVIETLIRADAVDLLGTNLFEIAGLIGILLLFEALIGGSLGVAVIAGFLNVSNAREALEMCGVTGLVLLILNFLHSYLLVVRFSAVDIMRRNVVEV